MEGRREVVKAKNLVENKVNVCKADKYRCWALSLHWALFGVNFLHPQNSSDRG